jgi:hypothetical protein
MENDNVKFKIEFEKRPYNLVLRMIKFINKGNKEEIKWLLNELIKISNILTSSSLTLKGQKIICLFKL